VRGRGKRGIFGAITQQGQAGSIEGFCRCGERDRPQENRKSLNASPSRVNLPELCTDQSRLFPPISNSSAAGTRIAS